MNLEDVLDPNYGLQQDEWSLTKPRFGEDGQLAVIGWSGRQRTHKYYILKCIKCSHDSELFGEGYFKSLKGSIIKGQSPCGCSKRLHWSKEQYRVLCSRKATELGHTFLGFVGEWKAQKTKIKMLCEKHGEWSSGIINNLINKGYGCPRCKDDAIAEAVGVRSTKPDDVMIDSFRKSGGFHPDTQFWRSERKDNQEYKRYWYVSCPECNQIGESISSSLQKGKRPCACSPMRQQEAYINWVVDDHNTVVAIKFGVANNSKHRIKQQDSRSAYTLKQHCIHQFPSVQQCKQAERECLQELETGVILKRDFPDGYTETTWVCNLERIIQIYERNGGSVL